MLEIIRDTFQIYCATWDPMAFMNSHCKTASCQPGVNYRTQSGAAGEDMSKFDKLSNKVVDGHHDVTAFGVSFFLMTKTCFVAWGRGAETMLQPSDTSWSSQHFRYSWGIPIWKHQTQGAFFFFEFLRMQEMLALCSLLLQGPLCRPMVSPGNAATKGMAKGSNGTDAPSCLLPLRPEPKGWERMMTCTLHTQVWDCMIMYICWNELDIRNDGNMNDGLLWQSGYLKTSDVKGLFCLRIIGSSQSSHDNHRLQLCTAPCLVIETLL